MNLDLPQRRRLEHEISRLQERVTARETEEKEKASRSDSGTVTYEIKLLH